MRKYSRKNGWMMLNGYASGDGSISFNWVSDLDQNGAALDEYVTESDISVWLQDPDNNHFRDWEIVDMAIQSHAFKYQICQVVTRPAHTSKRLRFDGDVYEYRYRHEGLIKEGGKVSFDKDFYLIDGSRLRKLTMCSTRLALLFFLNNETVLGLNGIETRERR